jgi:hypothetical protein
LGAEDFLSEVLLLSSPTISSSFDLDDGSLRERRSIAFDGRFVIEGRETEDLSCVTAVARRDQTDTLRSPLILLGHLPRDFGEGFQA